jgi:hypothetical protein
MSIGTAPIVVALFAVGLLLATFGRRFEPSYTGALIADKSRRLRQAQSAITGGEVDEETRIRLVRDAVRESTGVAFGHYMNRARRSPLFARQLDAYLTQELRALGDLQLGPTPQAFDQAAVAVEMRWLEARRVELGALMLPN